MSKRLLMVSPIPNAPTGGADTLLAIFGRATGETPQLSGNAIVFGHYRYRYASDREGTAPAAGFAPAKAGITIYLLDGVGAHRSALADLGPHQARIGSIVIKDLAAVDPEILEEIIASSFKTHAAATYRLRAREGREG
jgi:hypothetical protein